MPVQALLSRSRTSRSTAQPSNSIFPEVRIGVAEYEEGPTGATVFSFAKPVKAAVDVRGGGPGTIDTDVLRLGYDESLVNAISFRADRRTAWRLLQAWPTQSEIRVRK